MTSASRRYRGNVVNDMLSECIPVQCTRELALLDNFIFGAANGITAHAPSHACCPAVAPAHVPRLGESECGARSEAAMAAPKAITCFVSWLDTNEVEQVIAGGDCRVWKE